jgi:WD40 repeat protein
MDPTALRRARAAKLPFPLPLVLVAGLAAVAGAHALWPPAPERPAAAKGETDPKPRVDRFGDPLPEDARARLGTMRFRHAYGTGVAFSPDSKSLHSCGADRVVRTWDAASGRLLREVRLPPVPADLMGVVSPDGRLLAFQEMPGTLTLWDLTRNQRRHQFSAGEFWPQAAFAPDGRNLATGFGNGEVWVWDVVASKGRVLGRHARPIYSLAFSADGTLLSCSPDGSVRLWDLATGRERSPISVPGSVLGAALSADGRVVATWTDDDPGPDRGLEFWDAATGKPAKGWTPPAEKQVRAAQFSPDGKIVTVGTNDGVLLWDPLAGRRLRTLPRASGIGLTFSPDGTTVAVLGGARGRSACMALAVSVWDVATGIPRAANAPDNGYTDAVRQIALSPDGRVAVTSAYPERDVRLWDTATGRPLRSLPSRHGFRDGSLAFTPDGKYLLDGAGGAVVRWEVRAGRASTRYTLPGKADQSLVAVQRVEGHTVLALGWSLAQAGKYDLHTWDAATGRHLRTVPVAVGGPHYLAAASRFSPDGRFLLLPDGTVHDAATGGEIKRLSLQGEPLGEPLAFSPDGAQLAASVPKTLVTHFTMDQEASAVQVWEAATLLPVAHLETGAISQVAFTPDGLRLATAGVDALRLWDLATGREVLRRPARAGSVFPSPACALALSADGRTAITGHMDTTALVWDLPPPAPARPAPLTADQREALWADLAGEDPARALAAVAQLADAPAAAVALLRERLHPAQAPPADELREALTGLDAPEFAHREAAARRLEAWGEPAHPALREALAGKPSPEVRRRLEALLAEPWRVREEDRPRLRAIRALEAIGTAEARQVLKALAAGTAEARLTRQAKAALERLAGRAAP